MAFTEKMDSIYDKTSNAFLRDENSNFYKIVEEIVDLPFSNIEETLESITDVLYPEADGVNPWEDIDHTNWKKVWGNMLGISNQYMNMNVLGEANYTTGRGICALIWSKFENAGDCDFVNTGHYHQYRLASNLDAPKYTNELYKIEITESAETKINPTGSIFNNGNRGLNHQFELDVYILKEHGSAISPSVLATKYESIIEAIISKKLVIGAIYALNIHIVDDSTYQEITY